MSLERWRGALLRARQSESFTDALDGARARRIWRERCTDLVRTQIRAAPGDWHSHPGPVVVLIASGRMSFYDGEDPTCTARTYSTGQAFVDSGQGHVHIARNEGSVPLELFVTYFDVTPGVPPPGAFRIDAPDPGNCSF